MTYKPLEIRNSRVRTNNTWERDRCTDRQTGIKGESLITVEGWKLTGKHGGSTELKDYGFALNIGKTGPSKNHQWTRNIVIDFDEEEICVIVKCFLKYWEGKEDSNYTAKKTGNTLTEWWKSSPLVGVIYLQMWCPEKDTISPIKYPNRDCIAKN